LQGVATDIEDINYEVENVTICLKL